MKLLLPLAFVAVLLTGCKDDEPEIEMESPSSGDTYDMGATLNIHGDIEDDKGLASYSMMLVNVSNNDSLLWEKSDDAPSNPTHIDESFVLSGIMHSDLRLDITATDDEGQAATESIPFHVHL